MVAEKLCKNTLVLKEAGIYYLGGTIVHINRFRKSSLGEVEPK